MKHNLFEIGEFLVKVLGALKPANSILQAHSVDLCLLLCMGGHQYLFAGIENMRGINQAKQLYQSYIKCYTVISNVI